MKSEVERTKLPISLNGLGEIADTLVHRYGMGVTARQEGDWLVFEIDNAAAHRESGEADGCQVGSV
jgi:hypothetical protein